jgi:hypothetical protein
VGSHGRLEVEIALKPCAYHLAEVLHPQGHFLLAERATD